MTGALRLATRMLVTWWATRLFALLARLAHVSQPLGGLSSRRNFTRNAVLGGSTLVVGLGAAGFVRLLWPNKTGDFGSALTVPAANIPPVDGEPFQFQRGKFYVVHNSDGLLALYWKCPHLGCTVPWAPNFDQFRCPCHGSIYNYNGKNVGGPAPRPMDLMAITVQASGDIVVDTGAITQRHDYDPSQATPYPA
jgi:cytochrome b6-f complex iron-sulfur subunit